MPKICLLAFIISLFISCSSENNQSDTDKNQSIEESYPENALWAQSQPYVVLVSIDGFRHDYAEKYKATNLLKMKQEGASTKTMLPSFPSKTFPNHYSIVTGMLPASHGLVSNSFYSRAKQEKYAIRNKAAVQDGSWYGGLPIWALAEKKGMLSASYFWVGSEAVIQGEKPTYVHSYDGSVPNGQRVAQVIEWLNLPPAKRPHMVTLYFSLVDDFGHRYGPNSPKMQEAITEIDSLMGVLQTGIEKTDLPVYLMVTSDHGMSAISHGVVLTDYVDLGEGNEVYYSTPTMIYTQSEEEKERLFEVLDTVSLFDTYNFDDLPKEWQYQNKDRTGDLILVNHAPTIILSQPSVVSGGTHGFDPLTNQDMGAIYYVTGPNVRKGSEIKPFQNIHIYPFMAHILGLEYNHEIDGDLNVLLPVLND